MNEPLSRAEQAALAVYWSQRYQEANTPWDLAGPTPELARRLDRLPLLAMQTSPQESATARESPRPTPAVPPQVLIPGCGTGYDGVLLAQAGHRVTAIDFAPEAIARCQQLAEAAGVGDCVEPHVLDLFELPPSWDQRFDWIWEYTCYCAIPPQRRDDYAAVAARVLKPGGVLCGLFFPTDGRPGGPPFAVDLGETVERFAHHGFVLVEREVPEHSHPKRRGHEQWVALRLDRGPGASGVA